jgi:hypothetical protein
MKLMNQNRPRLPIEDYTLAIRNAVDWLGDRYLLAAPIKARPTAPTERRFYGEEQRWHPQLRERD